MGDTVDDRIKSATRLSLSLGLLKVGEKLDVRVVTMLIWQSREHPEVVKAISEILTSEVAKKEVFNGIEFYLPQLAHMLIHLDVEWPDHVLEQFTYMVAQHSIHFALQMHWFLYSALADYQPKYDDGKKNPKANPQLFMRCATLMHGLERAIVYGNVSSKVLEQRYHDGEINKEQLDKLRNLDRLDNAERIAKFGEDEGPAIKGRLLFLEGKESGGLLGKKWKEMHMQLKLNMLLFYNSSEVLLRAIPLYNAIVLDPNDESMTEEEAKLTSDLNRKGHDHYFELREKNREQVFKFRAVNRTQRKKWVRLLRQCSSSPPVYEPADITLDGLSGKQQERFDFYRAQLRFARDVTDICDSLRALPVEERKAALRHAMRDLKPEGTVYNPLCKSSDIFAEILESVPKDCFPFSTKENVPCLMTFKVSKNSQQQDVANVLHDKFNDDAIAGFFDSISHNILAPVRSLIARDEGAATNLLIKRPSLWNEEENITSLSAASNLPQIDDKLRFITKSHDDLRQEVFTMQLLSFLKDVWANAELNLYLRPFQILATSNSSGLVEFIPRAKSFDSLKKEAFDKHQRDVPLIEGFQETFLEDLDAAQKNFVESLAGYSVACYLLGIKNRHNGNIMMDSSGRIIHVDFSFVLGMAPGKNKVGNLNLSLESAAFKLTQEMVDAIGGVESENYKYFESLCVEGLMVARDHLDTIVTLVEIMGYNSSLACFNQPGGTKAVIKDLKTRFFDGVTNEDTEKQWKKKIQSALGHKGTLLYESYQKGANNIYPLK